MDINPRVGQVGPDGNETTENETRRIQDQTEDQISDAAASESSRQGSKDKELQHDEKINIDAVIKDVTGPLNHEEILATKKEFPAGEGEAISFARRDPK